MATTPWTGDPLQNPAMAPTVDPVPPPPQGIGQANKGAQVASGVTGVLQALQSGYQKRQLNAWNEAQRAYMAAKVRSEADKEKLAKLTPDNDPNSAYAHAKANADQSAAALQEQTDAILAMAQGGKTGGGRSKGTGGQAGQTQQQSKLGQLFGSSAKILTGRPLSHPTTTPTGAPPPNAGAVPPPPGSAPDTSEPGITGGV